MRLFSNVAVAPRGNQNQKGRSSTSKARSNRQAPSAQEIRDRVALHKKKTQAKMNLDTVTKKPDGVAKKAEEKKVATEENPKESSVIKEVDSDVGDNNPNDPATVDKLKQILKTGAFDFGDDAKKVLADIVMKN